MTGTTTQRASCCSCFRGVMNHVSQDGTYINSRIEEMANVLTHGIPAIVAVFGLIFLLEYEDFHDFETGIFSFLRSKRFAAATYGICLIVLYACSTLYHFFSYAATKKSSLTKLFHLLDQSAIFVFIAACYTPWLIVIEFGEGNFYGKLMFFAVWTIAVAGVIKVLHSKVAPVALYLLMGWIALILSYPWISNEGFQDKISAFAEIIVGGLCYTIGTWFLNSEGYIPFAHAIWHVLVVAGSAIHFHAVVTYLLHLPYAAPWAAKVLEKL